MRLLFPFATIALTSCVMPPPSPPMAPDPVLAVQLAGRVAGPPQSCVVAGTSGSPRAVDARTIAYESGRTIYINHLPGDCPGLRPLTTLIVEVSSGNYCRGDHVRSLEANAIIPGPSCNLGDWVPYRRP